MSGPTAGMSGEDVRPSIPMIGTTEGGMTAAMAMPGKAAGTFLTHFFGSGLADDRYTVERFKALVNGDIRRCPDVAPAQGRGRRKPKFATASLKAVKELRPARNEIIVCTWLRSKGGVQYWGVHAMGIGLDRRQRG